MMPTFPRSSLSFRTAGFPQYGWKAGFPSGAFLDGQRLKPAPGMRRPTSSLHPPFARLVVSTVVPLCVGPPTRLRTAVEGHYSSAPGALAQASRLIRDAFAVRERLSDPRVVPGFRCPFRPDMPPSLTPGSSIVVSVQNTDVDIGLRHGPTGSALPMFPQSVSCGARFSGLLWFATVTACQVAGPPVRT